MLDIKLIRDDVEGVIKRLETRGGNYDYLRDVKTLDEERRKKLNLVESIKNERNEKSKLIGVLKREGKDASGVLNSVASLGDEIKNIEEEIKDIEEKLYHYLMTTPNLVSLDVKIGKDETENREIKKFLKPSVFDFAPEDHVTIGEKLGIFDFGRATKVAGPRFVVYKGLGARLERALIMYMMDLHSLKQNYQEIIPPFIVNRASMLGTSQFPKFEDDAFQVGNKELDWFLNPTAEVPTINLHRDEILDGEKLPLKYTSFTTAFRAEAGSAGRDTRGILRQHQFNKVELIKFSMPEDSEAELLTMLDDAEEVLRLLEIPYRVVELCTGDIGFGMSKTYDIEVWLPGQNTYREIGSISNAGDFQARRANIRFRRTKDAKTEYVHTLNGSGLAVGRTLIAVIENYQQKDGSVKVPKVLIPYMNTDLIK